MKVFFDTNILVYLFDADAPKKKKIARDLLERHTLAGEALLSTQVLQEFYVAVTRKLAVPLDAETALQAVKDLTLLPLVQIDGALVLAAIQRSRKLACSFWDALIVQAALEGGAGVLYSEDMQSGQKIEHLMIENPLR